MTRLLLISAALLLAAVACSASPDSERTVLELKELLKRLGGGRRPGGSHGHHQGEGKPSGGRGGGRGSHSFDSSSIESGSGSQSIESGSGSHSFDDRPHGRPGNHGSHHRPGGSHSMDDASGSGSASGMESESGLYSGSGFSDNLDAPMKRASLKELGGGRRPVGSHGNHQGEGKPSGGFGGGRGSHSFDSHSIESGSGSQSIESGSGSHSFDDKPHGRPGNHGSHHRPGGSHSMDDDSGSGSASEMESDSGLHSGSGLSDILDALMKRASFKRFGGGRKPGGSHSSHEGRPSGGVSKPSDDSGSGSGSHSFDDKPHGHPGSHSIDDDSISESSSGMESGSESYSGSGSGDIDMKNASPNKDHNTGLQLAMMVRSLETAKRRGGGGGKGSHGGRGSHGGKGSHGSSEESKEGDDFDILELMEDNCGVDPKTAFENLAPVTPEAVQSAFANMSTYADSAATRLEQFRAEISRVDNSTAGASLETVYSEHYGLYEGFKGEMEAVGMDGVCVAAQMFMLSIQMEMEGTSGFADNDICAEAITMVAGLDESIFYEAPEDAWFHEFGQAMRSDMKCFINDAAEFRTYAADVAADVATYTPRQVTYAVTGLQVYSKVLGREIGKMMFAVDVVGDILEGYYGFGGDEENEIVQKLREVESLLKTFMA